MTDSPLQGIRIFDEKVDPSKAPVTGMNFAIYTIGLGVSRQEDIAGAGYLVFRDKCTYVLPAGPNNVNFEFMKNQAWVVILSTPSTNPISREKLRDYVARAKDKSRVQLMKAREKQDEGRANAQVKKAHATPGDTHVPKGRKK